jgi:hypothetical protein
LGDDPLGARPVVERITSPPTVGSDLGKRRIA